MTQTDIDKCGAMPDFKMDLVPYQGYSNIGAETYTGCGVSDLNKMIYAAQQFVAKYPNAVILFYRPWHGDETGASDTGSDVFRIQPVDIEDIIAIKAAFIAYWGNTDRPSDWLREPS